MNIRMRGRWLTARLRKLERASAAKTQTTGQISNGVDDGVTSQPGQSIETMCKGTDEGRLPEEVSGVVPVADQGER